MTAEKNGTVETQSLLQIVAALETMQGLLFQYARFKHPLEDALDALGRAIATRIFMNAGRMRDEGFADNPPLGVHHRIQDLSLEKALWQVLEPLRLAPSSRGPS